jgi:nitrogen-specific signal transduction histidine kinase
LIAGRNRLAAAHEAGLREVPCIVHAVSDAEAAELRAATRDAGRTEIQRPQGSDAVVPPLHPAQREIESALTTIESCAPLLNLSSTIARHGAAQVIAVECRRAQRVLTAMTVLGSAAPIRRALMTPVELLTRLRASFVEEQRVLGCEPSIEVAADQSALYGDADLLSTALNGALSALTAVAGNQARDLTFGTTANATPGAITLELTDHTVILPDTFIRSAFTAPWPVPNGDTTLLLLHAARWIVTAHGGSMWMTSDTAGTSVRLQLPAALPAQTA